MRRWWKGEGGGKMGGVLAAVAKAPGFACDCNADRLKRDVSRRHLHCGPLGATPAPGA